MTRNRSNSNHNIAMKGSLFSFPPVKLLAVYVAVLCAIGIQQQTARIVAATTPTALSFSTIEKEVDNYFEELSITEFARSYLLPPLSSSSSSLLDSTSNSHPAVEDLFRRVLSEQGMHTEPALPTYDEVEIDTKRSGIGSQFLNNHLSQAGVLDGSTGGTTITTAASSTINNRPRNQGVRGKNGGFRQAIASPNDVDNWSIDESCHTKTPSDHPLYREWNHHTTGVDAPSSNSPPNDAVTSSDYWEGMAQQYQARTTQGRKLHVPRFT